MQDEQGKTEEFRVSGEQLVAKVKEIFKAGNVRRIVVKKQTGETVLEIPVTFTAVAAILAPALVAVGAIAALAAEWIIVVERRDIQSADAPQKSADID